MKALTVVTLAMFVGAGIAGAQEAKYKATWESLDKRPLPEWFRDAKFGVFVVWGVYSVPAWGPKGTYAEWYGNRLEDKNGETWKFHAATYGEKFQYQDFAPEFRAELFNPAEWADLIVRSGARYVVFSAKYHDGFSMWPSADSWNWNSVDVGPHRDVCGELSDAVRARGLRMGFYYSLYEWYNPLYRADVKRYVSDHMLPQLKDLVQRYKPDLLWPDGEWDHPSSVWRSAEFLAWLFNESSAPKDVVVNDRWGNDCRNVHGGFATSEYGGIPEGRLIPEGRWEENQGMGASYGYNRNENVDDYRSATQLIHLLINAASRGGNLLLDVGPTADGRIPVIMQQRLIEIGDWLKVNGEAIYGTRAWRVAADGDSVRYTAKDDTVYAICLKWPGNDLALHGVKAKPGASATMLGRDGALQVRAEGDTVHFAVPALTPADAPCGHAYVFKLTNVE